MMIQRHLVMVAVLMSLLVAGAVSGDTAAGVPEQLADLQNSVNNISAPDQSNVRFTPPVSVDHLDDVACEVVNVTSVNQQVQVDQLTFNGSVAVTITLDLLPGRASGVGDIPPAGLTAPRWCRFIVVNGTRTAIRAAIVIRVLGTSTRTTLAAE